MAMDIARRAGELLCEGWGAVENISFKGEIDLVTERDEASEALIVAALRDAFPDHAIHTEEGGESGEAGGWSWLIDPLDGTTNYAHGFPFFAVSLAAAYQGRMEVGVVYDPLRDECFTARRGAGTLLNGKPIHVSTTDTLRRSLLATGFPYDVWTNPDNNLDHFANFTLKAQAIRRPGAAAIDLAYVACGRLDGFWELRLHAWDVAAGALLVHEAGGRVTDIQDDARFMPGGALIPSIVASNGLIHAQMLAVLEQASQS
jgi:myo-inositol-1(or 4)-monophosphatase